jgi:repressor LexA
MRTLTKRQYQVLNLIRQRLTHDGSPPTRAEIAKALDLQSSNTAEAHLKALARKGYIELLAGRNRNIRLLEDNQDAPPTGLPLVGRVAAGSPILTVEHIEGHYCLESLFSPPADYLLRVRGMSMREAGIFDGDLLAVKRTAHAEHGQIVVARMEDEVTVKRLECRNNRIRLLPENADFTPIDINPTQTTLAIEGIVVGVIRNRGL